MTLTYFTARSNLVTYAFLWEKLKIVDFSETIAACDLKVGRCRLLIEIMLDKNLKDKEVSETKSGSTKETVSGVDKKQLQLKTKEVEKLKSEQKKLKGELDEARGNLTSMQENIFRLLKIIVPDYDYGQPENVEKVILEFIRVNEEESQESSGS